MGLFKKKPKPEPAQQYSDVEQDAPPEPPADPLAAQLAKVLKNQEIIVGNQQVILDQVTKTQQMIQFYAAGAPEPEPEPTPEELKAAALALRKGRV